MDRPLFLAAVDAALSLSSSPDSRPAGLAYAQRACLEWLARWPGDFRVRSLLADACILAGEYDSAVPFLQQVVESDPESPKPYRTLSSLLHRIGRSAQAASAEGCLFGMGASAGGQPGLPEWADPLQTAVRLLHSGRFQEARLAAETVLRAAPGQPLPALLHLQSLWRLAEHAVVLSAGREYRGSWPGCAAFLLFMAQSCFSMGRNAEGVELLHAASVADPASEVADRYLGALNPYRSLWPATMQADLETALPSQVASAAGWNRLTAAPPPAEEPNLPGDIPVLRFPDFDSLRPEQTSPAEASAIAPIPGELFPGPSPDPGEKSAPAERPIRAKEPQIKEKASAAAEESDLEDLRRELNRVAARLRMRKSFGKETRRPAYILLTSRKRLASIYGAGAMTEIDQCLQAVLRSKRAPGGWSAYLADVDDAESMKSFGLSPVDSANAWQVKTLLGSIDSAIAKKGEMIGALQIIGGHEVIPFHLLPNPTDDDDADVPSDNPYASRDENYYVPEWPVGRIPTPSDSKAAFLLGVLRRMVEPSVESHASLAVRVISLIRRLLRTDASRFQTGSACSAAVWYKASLEVFRPLGGARSMLSAPPTHTGNFPAEFLSRPRYSYFNLHGLEHGPQWLGQRDSKAKAKGVSTEEFPIVLLPAQISGAGKVPSVVFTEACYGANIVNKGLGDAISLDFLSAGTRALAGSTKICYGAASSPLIAADLLARLFIQNCLSGIPAGESLRLAKLSFAEVMNRRQGFLDPEDQKTLTSFILLGDPLFVSETGSGKLAKQGIMRWKKPPEQIKNLFAKGDLLENGTAPSAKVQTALKQAMERYLPGMSESRMRYLHPRSESLEEVAAARAGKPARTDSGIRRSPAWVVALDKKYEAHGLSIIQYAKISVDSAGRVMKIAVSR